MRSGRSPREGGRTFLRSGSDGGGETHGGRFSSIDKRLSRDLHGLHDFLWVPDWKGNEDALRKSLLTGARWLDAFIGTGGRLRKLAESLATPWTRERQGASLFELLNDTLGLTAGTERARKGKHREAAVRAQGVVESTSIGVCSAANCFEIVEEWEARKIDFETYTGRLADVLQSKFIPQPGQFKRVLNAVYDFAADWDGSASKGEQALAARTAVEGSAWCVRRAAAIRALLGQPPKIPESDLGAILDKIVTRL